MEFLNDAYRHCKIIGTDGDGIDLLSAPQFMAKGDDLKDGGIITNSHTHKNSFETAFIDAVKMHRFWKREEILGTNK